MKKFGEYMIIIIKYPSAILNMAESHFIRKFYPFIGFYSS